MHIKSKNYLAIFTLGLLLTLAPGLSHAGTSEPMSAGSVATGLFSDYSVLTNPLFLEVLQTSLSDLDSTEIDSMSARKRLAEEIFSQAYGLFDAYYRLGENTEKLKGTRMVYVKVSVESVAEIHQFLSKIRGNHESTLNAVNILFYLLSDFHNIIDDSKWQRRFTKTKWQRNVAAKIRSLEANTVNRLLLNGDEKPILELTRDHSFSGPVPSLPAPVEVETNESTSQQATTQNEGRRGFSFGDLLSGWRKNERETPSAETGLTQRTTSNKSASTEDIVALLSEIENLVENYDDDQFLKIGELQGRISSLAVSEIHNVESNSLKESREHLNEMINKRLKLITGNLKSNSEMQSALEGINQITESFGHLLREITETNTTLTELSRELETKALAIEDTLRKVEASTIESDRVLDAKINLTTILALLKDQLRNYKRLTENRIETNISLSTHLSEVNSMLALRRSEIHSALDVGQNSIREVIKSENLEQSLRGTSEALEKPYEAHDYAAMLNQSEIVEIFLGRGQTGNVTSLKAMEIIVESGIRTPEVYDRLNSLLSILSNDYLIRYFRAFLDLYPDRLVDIYGFLENLLPGNPNDPFVKNFGKDAETFKAKTRRSFFTELMQRSYAQPEFLKAIDEARYQRHSNEVYSKYAEGLYVGEIIYLGLLKNKALKCEHNFILTRTN